jgi:chorismate synthase
MTKMYQGAGGVPGGISGGSQVLHRVLVKLREQNFAIEYLQKTKQE